MQILFFLSFVALAFSAYVPSTLLNTTPGTAGNNLAFYSSTPFTIPNVENPLTIEIVYVTGGSSTSTSTVCLNSQQTNFPSAANNLAATCPQGGLAAGLTNTTTGASIDTSKLKFTRKNASLRGQLLSKIVENTNLAGINVNGYPSDSAGFVVTIASDTPVDFEVNLYGAYCDQADEFPVNGTCVSSAPADTGSSAFTVASGTWAYYSILVPTYSNISNQLVVSYNITNNGNVFIQENYVPSTTWFLNTAVSGNSQIINTPGYLSSETTYYVGVYNPTATELPVNLTISYNGCAAGLIGPDCAVNQTAINSTSGDNVSLLSATLTNVTGDYNNNGDAWQYDLSDSSNAYAYFQLYDLPNFTDQPNSGLPYYVRVSVGNTKLEDDGDNFGPQIIAKLDGYPSLQSYDYSASGSVANQLLLPVSTLTDNWFIAVVLPSDFSIWVGVNCAGNCDDNAHGTCQCGTLNGTLVNCDTIANSTNQYYPLYQLPPTTNEPTGYCTCSDNDYDLSFDCSQKGSPALLFIVLIVIGGLIILFVAIGVPLYCYVSNKRKERYERI